VVPLNIAYIGSGTGKSPWLGEISRELNENNINVNIIQSDSESLDTDEKKFVEFLDELTDCSFVFITLHGSTTYFKKYERLIEHLEKTGAEIFIESSIPEEMQDARHLFSYPDEDYNHAIACIELGGRENLKSLILWVCKKIGGYDVEIPPLSYPPTEGFYHPDMPGVIDLDSHLKKINPEKPVIGISIYQGMYQSGNLRAVNALIREIESRGISPLTLFFGTVPNPVTGAMGVRRIVEEYLTKEGKPVVDVLIINQGFSQISLSDPNDGTKEELPHNFFDDLDIPLLQVMSTHKSHEEWSIDIDGLSPMEISSLVVWPEFDGQLIGVPISCKGTVGDIKVDVPVKDRVEKIASIAEKLAILRRTHVNEKKVAILIYQYTGESDGIGGAFGLDSPESVIEILKKMKDAGYLVDHIPETGNEVIGELIKGLNNDRNWISPEEMEKRAAGKVSDEKYAEWFSGVPAEPAEKICLDWGQPPGDLFVDSTNSILIPGVRNGNVFIGIQPPRGFFEQIETMYHSTDLVMPHHYLAYYRWLKHDFGCHAVIHLGTHGTLEWLPGKSVGLSENCYPDVVLDDIPHFYPYIIENPGEGTQAKRRSVAAILDHLIPAMMRADGYDEVAELDSILQEYLRSKAAREAAKANDVLAEALAIVNEKNFYTDLGFEEEIGLDDLKVNAERLYDYICEVKDAVIKDGLHIFGLPPAGGRFTEMIYALTRLDNGKNVSLRKAIANLRGYDIYDLIRNSSDIDEKSGLCKGAVLEKIDSDAQNVIIKLAENEFNPELCENIVESACSPGNDEIKNTARFICNEVVSRLKRTTDETKNLLRGLEGGYVPPGPSGPPTRGNVHILPTGRNFYSIDPATIPTPAAWKTGQKLADQMVEKHIDEKGCYPENVGIVVFATDTMKSGGDDIAYLLWLMGLRPVWSERGGAVTALEVIPSKELGRPRIDVTLRISGLFRDVFPTLMHMIDEGVEMIATLDESDDINFLSAHLRRDLLDKIKGGLSMEEAKRQSLIRIFGCPPGNYGVGVTEVVSASAWKDRKDLADVYTNWGAHAYGRSLKGERCEELFKERFGQVDVTVKNHVSRELDILDHDDDYAYVGGMNACAKVYGGKDPLSVIGDASDPDMVKTKSVDEEIRYLFRSRVLNPKWLEGLKPHGYRGVQELVSNVEYTFGWDVTSDAVDDWEYQEMAEHFLFDKETREWIEDNNPHALRNITGRLLEAVERGFWDADEETIKRLKELYLESEEILEGMTE